MIRPFGKMSVFAAARALKKISERVQIKEIAWSELSRGSEEKSEAPSSVSLQGAHTTEQTHEYSLIPEFLRGYYAMWPVTANADLYAIAMKALYSLLGNMAVMYTPKAGGTMFSGFVCYDFLYLSLRIYCKVVSHGYTGIRSVTADADLHAIAMKALYRLLGNIAVMYQKPEVSVLRNYRILCK